MNKPVIFWILVILSLVGSYGYAQSDDPYPHGSFSLVTNPAFFALGGFHLKPSYHFPKKWSVGATFQGGFELPEFAQEQFFEFADDQLSIDWTFAIGLELKYRFSDATFDKGLYAALNLGYEGWEADRNDSDTFQNWFTSLDLGYNWYPFNRARFHVGLAYTLIYILNNTDERQVGETEYRLKSLVPPSYIPSILVGWRF